MQKPLLLILVLLASLNAKAQPNWKKYEFADQHFSIEVPYAPTLAIDTLVFNNEPLLGHRWEIKVRDSLHENLFYGFGVTEYPAKFISSDSSQALVEEYLASTQKSLAENSQFELISTNLTSVHGYLGKAFKWKNQKSGLFFQFRVFLLKNRLYQLVLVCRKGQEFNESISRFFESFRAIDIPKGSFVLPDAQEQNFSVAFPGLPTAKTQTIDSDIGGRLTFTMLLYEAEQPSENLAFMAAQVKYPQNVIDASNPQSLDAFYSKSIQGTIKALNAEFVSVVDISYQKHPGREYRCQLMGGKALCVYRIFFINDHLYTVGVITTHGNDKNGGLVKFLDSFQLK
jgi:hypothetical protein